MSRYDDIEENEYPAISCDWYKCFEDRRWDDGDSLPEGWVTASYTTRSGYRYAHLDEIHHYEFEGVFCCEDHRDKWLSLVKSRDDGKLQVITFDFRAQVTGIRSQP